MNEVIFAKTHSLEVLVDLCISSDARLRAYLPHAQKLTPFATEFRYPGDTFAPDIEEAQHALLLAEEIVSCFEAKIENIPRPDDKQSQP